MGNTLVFADIFFFITAVAVIVVSALLIVLIIYFMRIAKDIRSTVNIVREQIQLLAKDITNARSAVGFLGQIARSFTGSQKKSNSKSKKERS